MCLIFLSLVLDAPRGAPITSASIPLRMWASGLWLQKNNKYITDSTDVESTQSSVMLPKSHWHVWYPQGVTDGWALGEDVCRKRWSLTCGFFSSFFVMLPCSTISYTGTPTVSILRRNHKGRVDFGWAISWRRRWRWRRKSWVWEQAILQSIKLTP